MKIEELYLAGFGRFSNKRIVLQDGLNLIFGENEAGKTTLQHFIVGMLYGFSYPQPEEKPIPRTMLTMSPGTAMLHTAAP